MLALDPCLIYDVWSDEGSIQAAKQSIMMCVEITDAPKL